MQLWLAQAWQQHVVVVVVVQMQNMPQLWLAHVQHVCWQHVVRMPAGQLEQLVELGQQLSC